jgi:hypothetical protein
MSVLGLPSKRLQAVDIPATVSLSGFLDISNRWLPSLGGVVIPVSADFKDPTTYAECSVLRGGDPQWNIAIPAGKNVFLEGGVYITFNVVSFRGISCGLRLYKNGSVVRSVGIYSGANLTDTLAMRCSTIIEPDEADEVRMLVGRASGTGNVVFSGGSNPYYGGWWKMISS